MKILAGKFIIICWVVSGVRGSRNLLFGWMRKIGFSRVE